MPPYGSSPKRGMTMHRPTLSWMRPAPRRALVPLLRQQGCPIPAALDHCIEFQIEYFLKNLGELPADLVERVLTWGELKVKMLLEEPLMFKMAVGGIDGNPKGLNRELTARMARITERLMPAFLSGIDFSSLREGISPQKAIEFVFLVINAASEKFLAATKDSPDRGPSALNSALEEIKEYGEFLRTGLYRH